MSSKKAEHSPLILLPTVLFGKINQFINIGKGETASVDEMISGLKPGMGFDIAGGMIGFIKIGE